MIPMTTGTALDKMRELLLFNIGNTHTQWVRAVEDPGGRWRWSGSPAYCDTAAWMADLKCLPEAGAAVAVWGACVVPEARRILSSSACYDGLLHWVDASAAVAAGMDWRLVDTSTLGADRIANAVALLEYPLPAANFDCGTAVTMEVVLADGVFAGGAIAPGRRLWRKALASGTAALPELELTTEPPAGPGRNTHDALAFGMDRGIVGMVREWMMAVRACGVNTLIVSGGDAPFFSAALPELCAGGGDFTLRGVLSVAARHV